ncbi:uncharacterized protein LOC122648017 [Telopea speciosissima]|uniref:uncharacterized protein LOC122648017 n=1 Tax=Telopea speciosissima TaxID=54955 RepID=UPI001CC64B20|nr:uncharacterized protein LOC122648017 [Telopea speciosissima]
MAILRKNGVPESNIVTSLTCYPRTMTYKNDRFKQRLKDIQQMGFDPSKYLFIIALHGFASMNKSTWKQKLEAYQRWGFSEKKILMALRRYPWSMTLYEKKIMSHMDFFVKKMGWESADIMRNSKILGFSLEKRVIPRCSAVRVLQLKGLVERDHSIRTVLIKSDKSLLEKFVTKYEEKRKIGLP